MAERTRRVPMPMGRRMQHVLAVAGPVAAWLAAAGLTAFLLAQRNSSITVAGLVEERRIPVSTVVDGHVLSMPVDLYDKVGQGDVVAVLDDSALRAELTVIRAEAALAHARAAVELDQVIAGQSDAGRGTLVELRRLAVDVNRAQLEVLDRGVEIATARIDLQRLRVLESRLRSLQQAGASALADLEQVGFEAEETAEFLREAQSVLGEAEAQLAESRERLEEFRRSPEARVLDAELLRAAGDAEAEVAMARLRALETTLAHHVLRSPLEGRVVATYLPAGSNVTAGLPLAEVATEATGRLVAWVPRQATVRPEQGDKVEVFLESNPGKRLKGTVRQAPEQVLPLPVQLLRNPQVPEYGMPVHLELEDATLPSGQVVRVTFHKGG